MVTTTDMMSCVSGPEAMRTLVKTNVVREWFSAIATYNIWTHVV